MKEVFKLIKDKADFDFAYTDKNIENIKVGHVNAKDLNISDIMKICLKGSGYKFKIKNNIVLVSKEVPEVKQQERYIVRGTIVDESSIPLEGVAVIYQETKEGKKLGAVTDENGKYIIAVPAKKGVLKFTYLGMTDKFINFTGQTEINIVLKESAENLNAVVISTGMQDIKQERFTGSVQVVKSKDLEDLGIINIDDALDGQVAGLNSTLQSGEVGVRAQITIRGENSLDGNTEPLWILDGLPMTGGVPRASSYGGDFAGTIMEDGVGNIAPEDIASITILKDAAAAAQYGARAANGVIVITTKKGYRSETKFSYSSNFTYNVKPTVDLNFMNSSEKLAYERSILEDYGALVYKNAGRSGRMYEKWANGTISKEEYDAEINRLSGINTNWFDHIFRPSYSQSHNFGIRGGTEKLSYYNSISYSLQEGILLSNKGTNLGVRTNLEFRPNNKMDIGFALSGNFRENKNHAMVGVDPFNYAVFANPYERPYNDDGSYAPDLTYLGNNYTHLTPSDTGLREHDFNILRELSNTKSKNNGQDLNLTLSFRYNLLKGLRFTSMFRYAYGYRIGSRAVHAGTATSRRLEDFGRIAYENKIIPFEFDNGQLNESAGKSQQWSMRNQLEYNRNFGDHFMSVLVASEANSNITNNFSYTSPIYDYVYGNIGVPFFEEQDPELTYDQFRNAIGNTFDNSEGRNRTASFLSTMRYSYKNKYVLSGSARFDGASVIGDNNQFTPLWSIGGRWNVSKEAFWQEAVPFINYFALRGSFGYTGNIDRTAYPFSTISYSPNTFNQERVAENFNFPNRSVRWSKKRSFNLGADLSFFESAITLGANLYRNRTVDILTNLEVQNSFGREQVKFNGGIVRNEGYELNAGVRWVNKKDLSFYTSVNFARNKNFIEKSLRTLNSYQDIVSGDFQGAFNGGQLNIIGEETGSIYGWEFAGVHPKSGYPMIAMSNLGKLEYAKLLDFWDTLTENQQLAAVEHGYVSSTKGIPDAIAVRPDLFNASGFSDASGETLELLRNIKNKSLKYLGRRNPKWIGGFSTTLRYKRWSLRTAWSFKMGHIIRRWDSKKNAPKTTESGGTNLNIKSQDLQVSNVNREKRYLYRWRNTNDITDIPGFAQGAFTDTYSRFHTTADYTSGDYLRMRSLIVSYRLPDDILKKLDVDDIRISITGSNLLTFTKFRGLDVATGGSFRYPTGKRINMRLSLGF
ncbi:SusC/RagA family TonB-linked outer membrane protein [Tamlana sp. 2201CG12-4]|uniref:SusC/RagA family TonB-linked outer membrane protein n=1 Tax=Tamlana sp. 2201CG12-4 TaxID=3112582 RepID=UPI002DB6FCBD|nr:SusC/RagA family TonB-linked outer membrane protein [Tamlana sp. 2201CG12-4]